jgi:hypothetical protein
MLPLGLASKYFTSNIGLRYPKINGIRRLMMDAATASNPLHCIGTPEDLPGFHEHGVASSLRRLLRYQGSFFPLFRNYRETSMPDGPAAPVSHASAQARNAPQASIPTRWARIDSIDLLRGLAMVVMALDHVRDFFTDVRFDPLDISQTTPYLFLTRWVTHHCAPAFVFLAGTGAFLYMSRGRSRNDLARFLMSRGLFLVLLELTVVRFAWLFNLDYSFVIVQVMWAIGWSMVALSGLIFLPRGWLALLSLGMIALHNMMDLLKPAAFGSFSW